MRASCLLHSLTATLLWLASPTAAPADIAVVVHPDSPVQTLSVREVSDLYLGRTRSIGSGEQRISTEVFEQPSDSPLRENFFRILNGMAIRHVNAYWARLRFSGEVLPPKPLPDSRAVIGTVSRNRHAIGYVDAATVDPSVRTVLLLRE